MNWRNNIVRMSKSHRWILLPTAKLIRKKNDGNWKDKYTYTAHQILLNSSVKPQRKYIWVPFTIYKLHSRINNTKQLDCGFGNRQEQQYKWGMSNELSTSKMIYFDSNKFIATKRPIFLSQTRNYFLFYSLLNYSNFQNGNQEIEMFSLCTKRCNSIGEKNDDRKQFTSLFFFFEMVVFLTKSNLRIFQFNKSSLAKFFFRWQKIIPIVIACRSSWIFVKWILHPKYSKKIFMHFYRPNCHCNQSTRNPKKQT